MKVFLSKDKHILDSYILKMRIYALKIYYCRQGRSRTPYHPNIIRVL
jgi:hypothetical protein